MKCFYSVLFLFQASRLQNQEKQTKTRNEPSGRSLHRLLPSVPAASICFIQGKGGPYNGTYEKVGIHENAPLLLGSGQSTRIFGRLCVVGVVLCHVTLRHVVFVRLFVCFFCLLKVEVFRGRCGAKLFTLYFGGFRIRGVYLEFPRNLFILKQYSDHFAGFWSQKS